jgi:sirohydrochlorin ferrochelatase
MNRDDIIRTARAAGFVDGVVDIMGFDGFANFAALVAAAERERMEIDSIHTCHTECQRPACVAVREAVKAERETCAKVCDEYAQARYAAEAIRARGEK